MSSSNQNIYFATTVTYITNSLFGSSVGFIGDCLRGDISAPPLGEVLHHNNLYAVVVPETDSDFDAETDRYGGLGHVHGIWGVLYDESCLVLGGCAGWLAGCVGTLEIGNRHFRRFECFLCSR